MQLPSNLDKFTAFYKDRHSGRKLDYDHAYSTATLKARFQAGTKDLSVSLFQTVVLLLFNDADKYTFEEIKGLVGMGKHFYRCDELLTEDPVLAFRG